MSNEHHDAHHHHEDPKVPFRVGLVLLGALAAIFLVAYLN